MLRVLCVNGCSCCVHSFEYFVCVPGVLNVVACGRRDGIAEWSRTTGE